MLKYNKMHKISDLSRSKELIERLILPKFVPIKIHRTYQLNSVRETQLSGSEIGKSIEKDIYKILTEKIPTKYNIYNSLIKIIGNDIRIEKYISFENIIGSVDICTPITLLDIKSYVSKTTTKENRAQILMYNIFNDISYKHICLYNPLLGILYVAECKFEEHIKQNLEVIAETLKIKLEKNIIMSKLDIENIPIFRGVFGKNHRYHNLELTTENMCMQLPINYEYSTLMYVDEKDTIETMCKNGKIVYGIEANFKCETDKNFAYPDDTMVCNGKFILTKTWDYNIDLDKDWNLDEPRKISSGFAYIPLTDKQIGFVLKIKTYAPIGELEGNDYIQFEKEFTDDDINEYKLFKNYIRKITLHDIDVNSIQNKQKVLRNIIKEKQQNRTKKF